MDIDNNDFLRAIYIKINDLFAEEIGPVGPILCEETRDKWETDLDKKGQRPGLRNMPIYVHKLAVLIEDEDNRQKFLNSVFEIEALSLFNKS
jgi:hypothetical protein